MEHQPLLIDMKQSCICKARGGTQVITWEHSYLGVPGRFYPTMTGHQPSCTGNSNSNGTSTRAVHQSMFHVKCVLCLFTLCEYSTSNFVQNIKRSMFPKVHDIVVLSSC